MLLVPDARFLLFVSVHMVGMLQWKGWFWVVVHYLIYSKRVYIVKLAERSEVWMVLIVLEGAVW